MVFPYMVKRYRVTIATDFLSKVVLHCYSQVATTFTFFRTILLNAYFWKAFVYPKRKKYMQQLWCPNYRKQYCTSKEEMFRWSTFLHWMSQLLSLGWNELYIAKKHSNAYARVVHNCKVCDKDIHSSYNLREHKRERNGAQNGSGAQKVDVAHVLGGVDDNSLK